MQYYSNTHTVKDHEGNNQDIEVYRIENDVNGNPRYVVHFLPFGGCDDNICKDYQAVVRLFNKAIHGRKYRAKWFGGGIVFSSYNIKDDLSRVFEVKQEMIRKALPEVSTKATNKYKYKKFIIAGKRNDNAALWFYPGQLYDENQTIFHRNDYSTIIRLPWDVYTKNFKYNQSTGAYENITGITLKDLKQYTEVIRHDIPGYKGTVKGTYTVID